MIHTRKNTDVFITLDENISGYTSKQLISLYNLNLSVRQSWTNSVDTDQTPQKVWSGLHNMLIQQVLDIWTGY